MGTAQQGEDDYLMNHDHFMKQHNTRSVKEYNIIAIGSGSAMNIVTAYLDNNPEARVAVIDKDEPGGICMLC